MKKLNKSLKLTTLLVSALALLLLVSGCGQSRSSSQSTPTNAASSSSRERDSSSTPTASSTPAPAASKAAATASEPKSQAIALPSSPSSSSSTDPRPSNEVLYLLAYIKYRGGIQNITPSDLIVDQSMIGTQEGTVFPDTVPTQVPLQMIVEGKGVEVVGPAETAPYYAIEETYYISNLVSEFYSTLTQREQINSLLQEGQRHNLLDLLALWKSLSARTAYYEEATTVDAGLNGGNSLGIGAGTYALIVINGNEITLCINSASGADSSVTHQYYHFTSQALINEYYSTPAQKVQINSYIRRDVSLYR